MDETTAASFSSLCRVVCLWVSEWCGSTSTCLNLAFFFIINIKKANAIQVVKLKMITIKNKVTLVLK